MTSTRDVTCPDTIEVEIRNDHDSYEHDMPTYTSKNDRTYSLDETTSSIVSDSTEGSTIDCNIVSAVNLPQHDLSSNNICIERSSDILIGSKTHFNGSVVIQNFIAGNEGHNSFVLNQDPAKLETPTSGTDQTSNSNWLSSLSTYIPCKSKWIFIISVLICVISVLSGLAVAAYFLYLHFAVYRSAGALFVCKTTDSTVCYVGSSTTSCSNLVSADGRPYISGHTTSGSGICKIYSKKNCQGDMQEIGNDHTGFYFSALSARC